jgi:hypothetical protein
MKGRNRYGAAGKHGVPASTVVAFLDHYTYEGRDPFAPYIDGRDRAKRINGKAISPLMQRTIRRYRNGAVDHVSVKGLSHVLTEFGFDLAWFHGWCKLHRKPIT